MKAGTIFVLFFAVVALIVLWMIRYNVLHPSSTKYQPVMDSIAHGRTYQLRNLETGITVRKIHITNANGDIIASYYETPIVDEDSLLLDHSKIP